MKKIRSEKIGNCNKWNDTSHLLYRLSSRTVKFKFKTSSLCQRCSLLLQNDNWIGNNYCYSSIVWLLSHIFRNAQNLCFPLSMIAYPIHYFRAAVVTHKKRTKENTNLFPLLFRVTLAKTRRNITTLHRIILSEFGEYASCPRCPVYILISIR